MSDSLKNKILLSHGSREIVEYPEIRLHRFNKDFYFGFYCTKIAKQAERWATRYDNLYYQPREYISLCYKEGKICA